MHFFLGRCFTSINSYQFSRILSRYLSRHAFWGARKEPLGPWLPVTVAALGVIPITVKVPIGLSKIPQTPPKKKKTGHPEKKMLRIRIFSFKHLRFFRCMTWIEGHLQASRVTSIPSSPEKPTLKNIPIFPGFNQQILVIWWFWRRSWHLEILHWSPARWQGYDEHRSCQTRVVMPGSPQRKVRQRFGQKNPEI